MVVGALRVTLETEAENGKGLKCPEGEIGESGGGRGSEGE